MIEDLLNYLETTSLEPHDDYTSEFAYKEQKILYKYIKQLQQENKKQKEVIDKAIEHLNKFSFEINVNGQKQYIKLQDLPQGKEVLKLLNGVSE